MALLLLSLVAFANAVGSLGMILYRASLQGRLGLFRSPLLLAQDQEMDTRDREYRRNDEAECCRESVSCAAA